MIINDKSILINSKKLSQSTNNVANQVVIIHQNQSNLLIDDLLNNNNLIDNGNRNDGDMSEIKYMKGYVNVLKERFTRKSLGNDGLNDSIQEKHKNRLSMNLEGYRRRSVSPFVSSTSSTSTTTSVKLTPKTDTKTKLFASQDDLRNSKLQLQKPLMSRNLSHSNLIDEQMIVKCTYLNEINKDELPKPNFVSSVKNLFEKQIKNETVNSNNNNNNNNVHTHHHHHHQNVIDKNKQDKNSKQLLVMTSQQADNLVERLKQNGTVVYQHNYDTNHQITNSHCETETIDSRPNSDPIETKKDTKKSHYKKHLSNATNINIVANHQHPPTNGLDKENKSIDHKTDEFSSSTLSFKERKELFSKKQQTPHSVQNNHYHSPHQTNQTKRFKTEYAYNTPANADDDPKSNNSISELNSNNNNNNSSLHNETLENDTNTQDTLSADNVLEQQKQKLKSKSSVKMKTYYGGEEIKDLKQLNLSFVTPSQSQKPLQLNPVHQPVKTVANSSPPTSIEYFNFEFIGAGVKLDKSILIVNSQTNYTHVQTKKSRKTSCLRVNFTEQPETYEYPSFEFALKEMGFDPMAEEEVDELNQSESESSSTSSLTQFLPGRFSFEDDTGVEADNESESHLKTSSQNIFDTNNPTNFTKLSSNFTNFKPSWHKNYELGSIEHLNVKQESNGNSIGTSSTESLTNDILPTRDDEIKKWSSDMDANILF